MTLVRAVIGGERDRDGGLRVLGRPESDTTTTVGTESSIDRPLN